MTYDKALDIMIKKQSLGIMSGLSRILKLLDEMGNPQDKLSIIHVAGTNGKGTVAATVAAALSQNGCKTGLFTSPWVDDYTEQISIDGRYIDKEVFADYVERYKDNPCSEFEFLTAIMYKFFADEGVDYAVVECGMGGAGDATNVESNNLSVITSVSIDHTDFLGNTLEQIAYEKSGIIKDNCACILYPNKECEHIFENVCNSKNASLIRVQEYGDINKNNLETARLVLKELGYDLSPEAVQLPARQERLGKILLDGGHNYSAGKHLCRMLDNEVAIIGMMRDKDVDGYLSLVAPHCMEIITVTPDNRRALSAKELREKALAYCNNVVAIDNPLQALDYARGRGLTLVCGSFYLARQLRKELL